MLKIKKNPKNSMKCPFEDYEQWSLEGRLDASIPQHYHLGAYICQRCGCLVISRQIINLRAWAYLKHRYVTIYQHGSNRERLLHHALMIPFLYFLLSSPLQNYCAHKHSWRHTHTHTCMCVCVGFHSWRERVLNIIYTRVTRGSFFKVDVI
jgi:hypothetical protein